MLRFVIENNRLICKSNDTEWKREATPEEFTAYQCGIRKGHELIALEIKNIIMGLKVKYYPEHPSEP